VVPKYLAIGIGMWIGTIMSFNAWFVIWPNQQKVLNIGGKYTDLPAADKAAAGKTAMIFSRINTLLSLPMLFSMVAAGHLY
ncbi:MAG TPA: urate hydroxylase PuuD, partial [Rhizomicrobium sp.]|nr:urate hydroxylase PuuD [Rhizomicrobium sp.]